MRTAILIALLALALAQTASAGTDINQTRAGLFAYYKLTSNEVNLTRLGSETGLWNCGAPTADPHYIEGYVCVDNDRVGSTSGSYNQVRLRVKRDGWIMAYVYNDERPNLAGLVYWGRSRYYLQECCSNYYEFMVNDTVLGEAIKRAMATASINEAYNRDSMLYWHFQKPGAKRIRVFGNGKSDYYGDDDYSYAVGTQLDPTLGAYMSYGMGYYYGGNYVEYRGRTTAWNSGQKSAETFYIEDQTTRQYTDGQPNFIKNYEYSVYQDNTVSAMFVIA